MNHNALFWFFSTIAWTMLMSFYSTQEMACISFNRLRLEYFVTKKKRWAMWLHHLLDNPTTLFSTTLIGVNISLMASSECARRLYDAVGWNQNLAPLTQIPFILLFGELVPMFAARIYAEHMARLGVPLLYVSATILTPFSSLVDLLFRTINKVTGIKQPKEHASLLSRDELQKLIEESELPKTMPEEKHINDFIANIFSLKSKSSAQLMEKLVQIPCISTQTTIKDVRAIMQSAYSPYIPVYHRFEQKVLGIVRAQDLLEENDTKRVGDFVQNVCFVSENTTGFQLLKQLQKHSPSVALVLNVQGSPIGIISIDDILEELFYQEEQQSEDQETYPIYYLERSFAADTSISDFNDAFHMQIDSRGCTTFAELIEHILGRAPGMDEVLFVEPIEIIVKETSVFKAKTILIRSSRR